MARALLITGATGKQGGAVINALLKSKADFEILAVTRNAQSASAQRLVKKSSKIKLVTGDLDAVDNVFKKAKAASTAPIWGVYSVQATFNHAQEEKQGKGLVDIAVKEGVKHFVYSSVDRGGSRSDSNPTNIPHFITKHNIERHLFEQASAHGMKWTVLRPVAFFENLVPGFMGKVFTASWDRTLKKNQKLQLIATSDIGHFAAEAFLKPDEYNSRSISLAGDELTYSEFKKLFEKKIGQKIPTTYHFIAGFIMLMVKDLGYMFKWFRDVGYGAEISSLKREHPEIKDFGAWLEEESAWKSS